MTCEPIKGNRYFEGRMKEIQDGRHPGTDRQEEDRRSTRRSSRNEVEIELTNIEKANLVPEI